MLTTCAKSCIMGLMGQDSKKQIIIYRVLIFRRGQEFGSLKILARSTSEAFRIARAMFHDNFPVISLRLLELLSVPYSGQESRVLSREGVNNNGGETSR